jgi:hypothetical protein
LPFWVMLSARLPPCAIQTSEPTMAPFSDQDSTTVFNAA